MYIGKPAVLKRHNLSRPVPMNIVDPYREVIPSTFSFNLIIAEGNTCAQYLSQLGGNACNLSRWAAVLQMLPVFRCIVCNLLLKYTYEYHWNDHIRYCYATPAYWIRLCVIQVKCKTKTWIFIIIERIPDYYNPVVLVKYNKHLNQLGSLT